MLLSSRFRPKNVFVTVGSTSFDELIEIVIDPSTVDHLKRLGCCKLTVQSGQSVIDSKNVDGIEFRSYRYADDLKGDIKEANLVIGHAGAGTCLEVLRERKRLLVVANDNLMDCHQDELADKLMEENYLIKTKLENFHVNLDKICNQNLKLRYFPSVKESRFESILNESLIKAKEFR